MSPSNGQLAALPPDPPERDRKAEHIRLALDERMQVSGNLFEDLVFEHRALPEIDFDEIDLSVTFLGKPLKAPWIISCMTGGTGQATVINRNLAAAAAPRIRGSAASASVKRS